MGRTKEVKDIECPKCKNPAKEITIKQVDLLDFGGGPTVSVYPVKKEIKCLKCGNLAQDMAGDVEERYQDDE